MRRLASRLVGAFIVSATVAPLIGAAGAPAAATDVAQGDGCVPDGCVRAVEISGLIDRIVASSVTDTVRAAAETPGVTAIMLVINSPGEVLDRAEFEDFVRTLVRSPVPVTGWIGPAGSEALGGVAELIAVLGDASAAPGSTVGMMGAQRLDRAEFGEFDRGERAAMVDSSLEAEDALRRGVIDRVAPTAPSHLIGIAGVKVTDVVDADGKTVKQPQTRVVTSKLPFASQMLHTVASPAVAYLLLAIGLGLLIFEFFTAGVGVAGVVGAVCVLGAGYGLSALPVRPWALGLCVLAAIVFCFDIAVGVPRAWTAIGLALWGIGSFTLYTGVGQPWIALSVGVIGMAVAMVSGMPSMVRARFGTPTIGREHLIGMVGRATSAIAPDGAVSIDGAPWRAMTNRLTPIVAGDEVRVVAIDGLTLEVEPIEGGARDYRELRDRAKVTDDESAAR